MCKHLTATDAGEVSKCTCSVFIFRAKEEHRWHSRTAQQNHGGVETGAIYGGEDTSKVNYFA